MKLYVGNLNYETTEESLKQMFEEIGAVKSFTLIKDRMTGRPKGFGFVEYETDELGNKAIAEMNEKEVNGRKLSVSVARPMEKRSFGGGGGSRGGGGRDRGGYGGGGDRDRGGYGSYRDKKYS